MSGHIRWKAALALSGCLGLTLGSSVPGIGAHTGHPTVTTTSCSNSGCGSAVFAVCDPDPGRACATDSTSDGEDLGPRLVTVNLHGFSADTTVHVWWLKTEVDNPAASDCSQAANTGRTHLADATTNSNGDATISNVSLPPGEQGDEWEYGANWVCATTAGHSGGNGEIADRMFTIYPA